MSDVRHKIEVGYCTITDIDETYIVNFDIVFSFDSDIITMDASNRRFDESN
jgi:hypothetical protein